MNRRAFCGMLGQSLLAQVIPGDNLKAMAVLLSLLKPTDREIVTLAAFSQGVEIEVAKRIVTLESDWDANAAGDNGDSCGLWQFKAATWRWFCELAGVPEWGDPDSRFDPVRSSLVACWAIANGFGHHWSTWGL